MKRYSHFVRMGRVARRMNKTIDRCKLSGAAKDAWLSGWQSMDDELYHIGQGPCDGYIEDRDD